MQVQLAGKVALLAGDGLEVGAAVAAALAANGAGVTLAGMPSRLDLLVTFSQDAGLPLERLAATCRAAAGAMSEGGRILNLVSVTGLVPMRGDDTAPMQAAAVALTRVLALELGPRGILANALAVPPGPQASRRMASHAPGGRAPDSAQIADVALFLLDPENTYTTGHVLVADGGWTIGYGRDF